MPPSRRRDLVPRRRRAEDEGEEEESALGDFEQDSFSDGSALSIVDDEVDAEGSEVSAEGENGPRDDYENGRSEVRKVPTKNRDSKPFSQPKASEAFRTTMDTHTVLNGLKSSENVNKVEEIHFDDLPPDSTPTVDPKIPIPKAPRNETPAQRNRREHQEYLKERNTNPAFVPNRGGFFLHDDRSSSNHPGPVRAFARGRGSGYNEAFQSGRNLPHAESTEKTWAHDLHEGHETTPRVNVVDHKSIQHGEVSTAAQPQVPKASTSAPNRSFSFTSIVGNVSVQVFLPGMPRKLTIANVVKKQHTLLPQHRPPLRRDKPVRISIPEHAPRYIFPSTERSFIFIPRALRPNQQVYARGRGRGSFHGSRRTSTLGGSTYTPSVAMSRKSSIGTTGPRDGLRSPAESTYGRSAVVGGDFGRPIVRLPFATPTPGISQPPSIVNGEGRGRRSADTSQAFQEPIPQGRHSVAIPIHQPRPQKAVSVADIESPASFPFKAPQPQQELPFHQQMPSHVRAPFNGDDHSQLGQQTASNLMGGTPLSHIPEGAIYANPFQPYPILPGTNYFPGPYPNGGLYYPSMNPGMSFAVPMAETAMAPNFVPGSQTHPVSFVPPPNGNEATTQQMMAHETNGMVYYYGPPQFSGDNHHAGPPFSMAPNGGNVGLGPMTAPPNSFYYSSIPNEMFYPGNST